MVPAGSHKPNYVRSTRASATNKEQDMSYPRIKLWEATIRTPDGKEFKDRVGAQTVEEARQLLQQRHGPRAVPYLPRLIPS